MVAEHLAVVAHEDHQRPSPLAGPLQGWQEPADVDVDQVDHRPVSGADQAVVDRTHLAVRVEPERPAVGPAVVDALEARLVVELAGHVVGQGDLVEPVEVGGQERGGRVERVVGVEAVEREEPGGFAAGAGLDEADRLVDAPGGLVVLGPRRRSGRGASPGTACGRSGPPWRGASGCSRPSASPRRGGATRGTRGSRRRSAAPASGRSPGRRPTGGACRPGRSDSPRPPGPG